MYRPIQCHDLRISLLYFLYIRCKLNLLQVKSIGPNANRSSHFLSCLATCSEINTSTENNV